MKKVMIAMGLCALGLAGCGGDGDSQEKANGFCRVIAGNGATVTATPAATASFTNPNNAFDGSLSSYTALKTTAGTGTSSIQGTLGSGSEPAGETAGIYYVGTINSSLQITITTYLKGVQQDTGIATNSVSNDNKQFYGLPTTKAFDSIKATLALNNDAPELDIYELCVAN